jgi:hypothetical protein
MKSLQEKDAIRMKVLEAAYQLTDGDPNTLCRRDEIALTAELVPSDADPAIDYWFHQGAFDGTEDLVNLTATGVAFYENELRGPKSPGHTAPQQLHFNGPVGAVQTGQGAVANVVQNVGGTRDELLSALAEIRARIHAGDAEDPEYALATTDRIERELSAPNPDNRKLASFSAALTAVLTGTAANLLAAFIQKFFG